MELCRCKQECRGNGAEGLFRIAMSVLEQGNVREAQARWDESLEHYLEAYQRFLKIFGHGHFRVAAVGSKLGQHYERLGDYKKARYEVAYLKIKR